MADVVALIEEIDRLEEKGKFYMEAAQQKRAELRGEVEPGEYEAGDLTAVVSPNRRFNAKKAEAILSPGQFVKASKRVADRAKVEALYPGLIDDMMDDNAFRITIKRKESN